MFSYNISKNANNQAFKMVCSRIESGINEIKKEDLLVDVDGSLIQTYHTKNGEITVFNDYLVDAVYVDSELNLENVI
ncbi:MAG: hypothetical protein Q4B73_08510 [Lachnospiraceae bacterium]|nr:hypothetical protein [Lachnospiraceae bacterium]